MTGINYFKPGTDPHFWLSSRACPEIDMEFVAIQVCNPTVTLNATSSYTDINEEAAEVAGISIQRVFTLDGCIMRYSDENTVTATVFIRKGVIEPEEFYDSILEWYVLSLAVLGVDTDESLPFIKIDDKPVGTCGIDINHEGYLFSAGGIYLSYNNEVVDKITQSKKLLRYNGLDEFGYSLTTKAVMKSLEKFFSRVFINKSLKLVDVSIIQERIDELKSIYYSEDWIKYGKA